MTDDKKLRELDTKAWELIERLAKRPQGQSSGWSGPGIAILLIEERKRASARWEVQVSTDMGDSWYEVASSKARKYTDKQEAVVDACGWAAAVHSSNYRIYRVVRAGNGGEEDG